MKMQAHTIIMKLQLPEDVANLVENETLTENELQEFDNLVSRIKEGCIFGC